MKRQNRSVLDYGTEEELRRALLSEVPLPSSGSNNDDGGAKKRSFGESSIADGVSSSSSSSTPKDGHHGAPPAQWRKGDTGVRLESYHDDDTNVGLDLDDSHNDDVVVTNRNLDWILPISDPVTTHTQTLQQELQRLQILKSYFVSDTVREERFQRLTNLAARTFRVPICVITLIDLGRCWFLASHGMGGATEVPRREAFCAHTILAKTGLMVVPDAQRDHRLHNYAACTGLPFIRFYAGATLTSPEGFNLGTLCLISPEPRPDGLTTMELDKLKDLTNLVVEAMVSRRARLSGIGKRAESLAFAAHDLQAPLSGMQTLLNLLAHDDFVNNNLGQSSLDLLKTASSCSGFMQRLCITMDSLRRTGQINAFEFIASAEEDAAALPDLVTSCVTEPDRVRPDSPPPQPDAVVVLPVVNDTKLERPDASAHRVFLSPEELADELQSIVTNVAVFIKNLRRTLQPFLKNVVFTIHADATVPSLVLCDELPLFRATVNFVCGALRRANAFATHITVRVFVVVPRRFQRRSLELDCLINNCTAKKNDNNIGIDSYIDNACPYNSHAECPADLPVLVVECEDTGANIPVAERPFLYQTSPTEEHGLRPSLPLVARLVETMHGQYGFRPRCPTNTTGDNTGSVFWFSVPLVTPEHKLMEKWFLPTTAPVADTDIKVH